MKKQNKNFEYLEKATELLAEIFRENWMTNEDWFNKLFELANTHEITAMNVAKTLRLAVDAGIDYDLVVSKLKPSLKDYVNS